MCVLFEYPWLIFHLYLAVVYFQVPSNAEKVNYKLPGFLSKFLELQKVMWTTNAGLTDRHAFDSRPDAWPRLRRGIVRLLALFTQITA